MKSITIHGIDAELDRKISEKSKEYGLSQNRTVKRILETSLGSDRKAVRREQFSDLFGKWSTEEKRQFDKRIAEFEQIDEADWQE